MTDNNRIVVEVNTTLSDTAAIFRVVHQPEWAKRGEFSEVTAHGVQIDSTLWPEAGPSSFRLQGMARMHDNSLFLLNFTTNIERDAYVARVRDAIREINDRHAPQTTPASEGGWERIT